MSETPTKHNGFLDAQASYIATRYKESVDITGRQNDESVSLTILQALSLLAWLLQEQESLQLSAHLAAKEQAQ